MSAPTSLRSYHNVFTPAPGSSSEEIAPGVFRFSLAASIPSPDGRFGRRTSTIYANSEGEVLAWSDAAWATRS